MSAWSVDRRSRSPHLQMIADQMPVFTIWT
jgi:hypothetical protein